MVEERFRDEFMSEFELREGRCIVTGGAVRIGLVVEGRMTVDEFLFDSREGCAGLRTVAAGAFRAGRLEVEGFVSERDEDRL